MLSFMPYKLLPGCVSGLEGVYSSGHSQLEMFCECGFDFQGFEGCGYLRFRIDLRVGTSDHLQCGYAL